MPSARYLMTLTPEEREPSLEAAVTDALPLYEADRLKPEEERELAADLETGDFHDYNSYKHIKRLYKIQNNVYSYFTGLLSNGNQVLMGSADTNSNGKKIETPTFPLIEFDKDGNLLGVYTEETGPPFSPLRFTPGTISIKKFFISDQWIGITDLPEHYQDFLDHPENATGEEHFHYPAEIEGWREAGEFVLDFNGGDFYLSKDGELESS